MQKLTRLCLAHHRLAAACLAGVTLLLAAGLPRVHPEFGYRVLIGDEHPAVLRLDRFIERFGGGLPIQIGWECGPGLPCRDVFDRASLEMAREIGEVLLAADGVNSLLGPANAPLLVSAAQGFAVRRFVERGELASDAASLAQLATRDPLWRGVLVSPDATAAALVVQPVDSRSDTSARVSEAVERAIAPHRERGHRFHLSGDPIQNGIVGRDLAESTARLIPFTVLLVGAILLVLSRSFAHAAIVLATMGLALVWSFGLLGWLGWPQDGILEVLAPVILVVGVCDAVHLLAKYAELRAGSPQHGRTAMMLAAARGVGGPCAVTTLTTTAAFLSFTTSELATFHRFGAVAAFGSLACLLLTFSLLPLLAVGIPERQPRRDPLARGWTVFLESVLEVSERRAVPILAISAAVLVLCGIGWGLHLRVDHEWKESLGEQSEVVRAWRFMEDRIGRSDTLELEVELPADWPLEAPETLARLRRFSDFVAGLEDLRQPRSVLDVIERVNGLLQAQPATASGLPATRAANAEILELVGFDDPGLLAQWTSFDRSRVRISVGAPEQAFSTRERVLERIDRFVAEELPASWTVTPTGRVAVQFSWIQAVQATQLRSFPTALVLVFLLVAVFLRSARLGLAALVPTALPIVITLGAMGWSGMTLDVGRAMIAAIVLGIGVDDSIHVLDRYRLCRARGDAPRDAIREAVLHCGRAVVTTSVALSLGFLTLMASAWQSIASFGFLVAIAILGALAASLFVLPALIFAFSARRSDGSGTRAARGAPIPGALVGLLVTLPVVLCLGLAARAAAVDERAWTLPCWLLPQAHVLTTPGSDRCPLELLDEVTWMEGAGGERIAVSQAGELRRLLAHAGPVAQLGLTRRGRPTQASVALDRPSRERRVVRVATAAVVAGSLLVLPVLLLLRSRSRAALPLALFYAAIGISLVPALASQQSPLIDGAAVAALVVAPAALLHLAMVFPAEARMVSLAPRTQLLPYLPCAVLGGVALVALQQSPILWPTFVYLALAIDAVAWGVLLASCAFAAREAEAPWERARARFVLATGLTLPALIAALLSWDGSTVEQAATYLASSALVIPLPIGFAIGRYDLFDLGWRARRGAARAVYLVSGALAVATLLRAGARLVDTGALPDFGIAFSLALLCLLASEAVRQPLLGLLDSAFSPRVEALRLLRDARVRQLSRLEDEAEIARVLLAAVDEGLRLETSWLLLRAGDTWEPAAQRGPGEPPPPRAVDVVALAVSNRSVALRAETTSSPLHGLADAGLDFAAAVSHGDERLGVLLARGASRGGSLPGFEIDFVSVLCGQAAISIHRARLADERAAVERHTTTARVAVELMHDLGKDLGWIRRLASRLARRASHDPALRRAAAEVDSMAKDLARRLRSFVDDATARRGEPAHVARLDELLARCTDALRARHGRPIQLSHDPSLRGVRCPEHLRRTLTRALGHELEAIGSDAPLRIRAEVREDGQLRIGIVGSDGAERARVALTLPGVGDVPDPAAATEAP